MTIKKRLFLSNILMIFVPVVATVLTGIVCVGFIWLILLNGVGFDIHDREEFDLACAAIVEGVENSLKKDGDFSATEALLDGNEMAVKIVSGGDVVYSYGMEGAHDESLFQAANLLGNGATVTQGGRSLYVRQEVIRGTEYMIFLTGAYQDTHRYSYLKMSVVFASVLIAFAIVVSILFTNRFLTKFVLSRIEEPLDILAKGAKEIGQGNLDYRIVYDGKDEFEPVCTAFNQMAERLKVSIERTRRDEESRRELLAGISHDLRSPLTSIQAYVEGLLDGVASTPKVKRQYLTTVKKKAEDIDRLVSQLFLFSKLELDEYPMELRPLRLDEMAVMLVQEMKNEYLQKGLEISVNTVAVTVMADPEQLRRVLTNIMDNSVKYKISDIGHLQITVENTAQTGCITLSDDGPGVSEDALPKLFDVFYRSDPARKNPAGGSGLGLAIAAKTIGKMGGTIDAVNCETGGLSIVIAFPKEEVNHAENIDY